VIASHPDGRPLILAHRGASAHAEGNTLAAFRLAVAHGADGVELDVRFTADDRVVVHHDPIVAGIGPLRSIDMATLRKVRPQIPTLDETLAVLPDPGFLINVEIKNGSEDPGFDPSHRMAATIVDWVTANHVKDRVLVTSFNADTMDAVRSADATVDTGLLLDHRQPLRAAIPAVVAAGHGWVLPHHSRLLLAPRRRVAQCHEAALRVGTWTVDVGWRIGVLGRAGIDAVITNDPRAGRALYT
jgi:glycerophosphoryl diester phosphodiesterase